MYTVKAVSTVQVAIIKRLAQFIPVKFWNLNRNPFQCRDFVSLVSKITNSKLVRRSQIAQSATDSSGTVVP